MKYVCSRLSSPTEKEMEKNMRLAGEYCRVISEKTGARAFAPHSFLPRYIDDHNPAERAIALEFGRRMLTICDEVIIVLENQKPSAGMEGEIILAKELNIPIRYFNDLKDLKSNL